MIFISHSSRNNEAALRVQAWLEEQGYAELFLDIDPRLGLVPGQRWQEELKRAGERCRAVFVLISPEWAASRWCIAEFFLAEQLGKLVLPVLIAPTPFADLPPDLVGKYQIADISTPALERDGFARLAAGLRRAGLDPSYFPWPPESEPNAAAYRGLEALREQDAAIYFGREAPITKALDTLRRMRDGTPESILAIVGASGAGKSSFLRAGLLARLKRDDANFLCLPVMRPQAASLTAFAALLNAAFDNTESAAVAAALNGPPDALPALMNRLRTAHAREGQQPPTIVLPIDQAEELFGAANEETPAFLDRIAPLLAPGSGFLVLLTIRSDALHRLQTESRLPFGALLLFNLPPLPEGAFKEVIEGPARLAHPPYAVEPALTERLLHELGRPDALPLLAFTLFRLAETAPPDRRLTLAHYNETLRGIDGAIAAAVEAAFTATARISPPGTTRDTLRAQARAAFIPWLVQLDTGTEDAKRRTARLSEIPAAAHPLVGAFVDQRLLVSNHDGSETTLEVAHEAILRTWDQLAGWLREERENLRVLDGVRRAAAEWSAYGSSTEWLAHRGARLAGAEALVALLAYAGAFGTPERAYLAACRKAQDEDDAEALREKQGLRRAHRNQRIAAFGLAAFAILLAAGLWFLDSTMSSQAERSAATLAAAAKRAADAGNYDGALRLAVAGLNGPRGLFSGHDDAGVVALLRRSLAELRLQRVIQGPGGLAMSAAFAPDGRIAIASWDGTIRVVDPSGTKILADLTGHSAGIWTIAFSPDGTRLATAGSDRTTRLWDAAGGPALKTWDEDAGDRRRIAFAADGKQILTEAPTGRRCIADIVSGAPFNCTDAPPPPGACKANAITHDGSTTAVACTDGTVQLFTLAGQPPVILRGHRDNAQSVAFSPDGKRLVTASLDNTARIWDAATGRLVGLLAGHSEWVRDAVFSPDGTRIATASNDGIVRIWSAVEDKPLRDLPPLQDGIVDAAFTPDGSSLAVSSWDSRAYVLPLAVVTPPRTLTGHTAPLTDIAVGPDGIIVTASYDKTLRFWDAAGTQRHPPIEGQGPMQSAALAADGKTVAAAESGGPIRTFTVGGAETGTLAGEATRLAFAPDGSALLAAEGKIARLYPLPAGEPARDYTGHTGGLFAVAFTPDGSLFATGSDDQTAAIWKPGEEKPRAVLSGHQAAVHAVAFSPNGRFLATASTDGTARLWDVPTGLELKQFAGPGRSLETIAFAPDGTSFAIGGAGRTVRLWSIPEAATLDRDTLIARACEAAEAGGFARLSPAEIDGAALNQALDSDPCHPPSFWARTAAALGL